MFLLTPEIYRQLLSIALAGTGFLFIGAGFLRLMGFGYQNHARTLAAQSAKLGQKSISSDITSVVQAAVQLNESINGLLRTSAGVGAFLIFVGASSLTASYFVMLGVQ